MKKFLLFYTISLFGIYSFTAQGSEINERNVFSFDGSNYVFLEGAGPLSRLDADKACKDSGLSPIRTTGSCPGRMKMIECLKLLSDTLKKLRMN